MKKFIPLLMTAVICLTACSSQGQAELDDRKENENETGSETEVTEIIIPESYLNFVDADPEETAESYKDYCSGVEAEGNSVVIKVTEQEKDALIEMNTDFIEEAMGEFQAENEAYSCQFEDDFSSVTYQYDENISMTVQAKVLMGVTATYVLNGILENEASDWSVKVNIVNCHTGNTVAQGTLPEDEITFDESTWEKSYE